MDDIRKYTEQNRRAWNEIAEIRAKRWAEKHSQEQLRRGETLSKAVRDSAGDVSGRRLLHLQCASGEDSISWASLGAVVTGVDISERLIEHANRRAKEVGFEVRFVAEDLYDLPEELQREDFDIVFTGGGVLTWLPDLTGWARAISRALGAGGTFFIEEEHPLAQTLTVAEGRITMSEDYFGGGRAIAEPPGWNHFHDQGRATEPKYEFVWNIGQVVTALAEAGLRIERLEEFPTVEDQRWRYGDLLEEASSLPGVFLLTARKLASEGKGT